MTRTEERAGREPVTTVTASPARPPEREVFLDAVRVIALIRVVLWHAFGAAALTYFVAAVPAMFFVTGSLLAKSMRRGARQVIVDRARRILVPLWVFGVGAFSAMTVAHVIDGTSRTAVPWRELPLWVFPIDDPVGSVWEGGYLSAPLWYLRALLWLILLSPLLLMLVRRTKGLATLVPLGGVFLLDWLAQRGSFSGPWAWRVGDLALYSTFLMLGFVHRLGGLDRLTRRHWAGICALAAAGATVWCTTQPVPDNVVNDSHPAHLLVGLGWLGMFFVARPVIEQLAASRLGRALIGAVSQRTITIYLWHSTAIVMSFDVLRRSSIPFPPGGWVVAMLAVTTGVTMVFVFAFGWVEDISNKRSAGVWPVVRPTSSQPTAVRHVAATVAAVGALVMFSAAADAALRVRTAEAASEQAATPSRRPNLRVPSRAPKAPVFTTAALPTTRAAGTSRASGASTAEALERAVTAWMTANAVPGIEVAVYRAGVIDWRFGTGTDPMTEATVGAGTRFDISSITKTFTATLVWQAADRGLIDVDAPIGALEEVPELTYGELTPRQLLRHTAGLVNYRETPEYESNPGSIDTPRAALAASASQPLKFVPGTRVDYSSSNYLVLGFLLEQVTGRPFDDLLGDLVAEAGISPIPHDQPAPGLPNFSTAGLLPTASQLARWGVALLEDNTPQLSDAARAAMGDIDLGSGFGAGLMGFCPCAWGADGPPHWAAFGHTGGYSQLHYSPADDLAVVINVTDSIYTSDSRYDAVQELIEQLQDIALGRSG